jgi:hypothetical protein
MKTQEPRPNGLASAFCESFTGRRNGRWVYPFGNVRKPLERGKLRRVNPKSAVGVK